MKQFFKSGHTSPVYRPRYTHAKVIFHALSGGKEVGISKQCFTVSKHFDAAERGV